MVNNLKIVATNRELSFKYEVIEKIECGIVLNGTEVKSIRESKITLKEGFVLIRNGEAILKNVYIDQYDHGNINNLKETRDRKLLLHREELDKLAGIVKQGGYTIIPYKVGFDRSFVKVEIAVCKGKKLHDKREAIKEKEVKRKIERVIKSNGKNII